MLEIIAYVVSAEGQHRHRIPPDLTDRARRGCRCLGGHGGAEIDTMCPIERFINQWYSVAPPTAKNDGADRNSFAFLYIRVESRIIAHRRCKPAVGMRGLIF